MKKFILVLTMIFLCSTTAFPMQMVSFPGASSGGCGTEISQTSLSGWSALMYNANNASGQSIVANKSITNGSVKVTFQISGVTGTPGDSYIRIDDDADLSADTICNSDAFTVTANGDLQITITGCTLSSSTTYYIGMRHTAGDASNYYQIRNYAVDGNEYTDGDWIQTGTNSWNFVTEDTNKDAYFKVEICD